MIETPLLSSTLWMDDYGSDESGDSEDDEDDTLSEDEACDDYSDLDAILEELQALDELQTAANACKDLALPAEAS